MAEKIRACGVLYVASSASTSFPPSMEVLGFFGRGETVVYTIGN